MNDQSERSVPSASDKKGWRRLVFGDMRSRVQSAMLLISLIPMSVVAYQGYHCGRQAVLEHVHMHLVSVIEARRALIDEWRRERLSETGTLASLPSVLDFVSKLSADPDDESANGLVRILESVQSRSDVYESLMVYDAHWRLLAETAEVTHHKEEIVTNEFRTGSERASVAFLDVTHAHREGSAGLHIGYTIRDGDGSRLGFLVANMNLTRTLDPLLQERSGLWKTGKVYVTTRDLDIFSKPLQSSASTPMNLKTSPVVLECLSSTGPLVLEYEDYLGNRVLGTAMAVPDTEWIIVAEMDVAEALVWLDRLLVRLSVTFGVTLVMVIAVSAAVSRFLGTPLRELARVAHLIRGGRVEERLASLSGVEAEEVRQAFNLMLDELAENQKEIVRNATLASMGELSTRVVHEMRNPLSSIKMNIQALGRSRPENSQDQELADIAFEQTERVEEMLTDLLQFGRPLELRFDRFSFAELVQDVLRGLSHQAEVKGIKIVSPEDSGPTRLKADRELMIRALSNLILNAIDASPSGSEIELLAFESRDDSEVVQIQVSDGGEGIPPADLEKIFEPFYSTKVRGTGLGLANARKIAEQHGGSLVARTRKDGGACFLMTIPQAGAESRTAEDVSVI